MYRVNDIGNNGYIIDELQFYAKLLIEDLVVNKGCFVDVTTKCSDFSDNFIFKLHSNKNCDWHDGGYWNVSIPEDLFNRIFTVHQPNILPEELFEL